MEKKLLEAEKVIEFMLSPKSEFNTARELCNSSRKRAREYFSKNKKLQNSVTKTEEKNEWFNNRKESGTF